MPAVQSGFMKRVMISMVGAASGSLVGLLATSMGAGNAALFASAAAGGVLPHLVLGPPGH